VTLNKKEIIFVYECLSWFVDRFENPELDETFLDWASDVAQTQAIFDVLDKLEQQLPEDY